MRAWLIDDKGDLRDQASAQLRLALGGFSLGSDFAEYVIKNLGFISVIDAPGAVRVRFRPQVISEIALAALLYWLNEKSPKRVVLSTLGDAAWSHEVCGSADMARLRMIALTTSARTEKETKAFRAAPIDPQTLPFDHPLTKLLRLRDEARDIVWNTSGAEVADILKGRFLLVEADQDIQRMTVRGVGLGLDPQAHYWLSRGVGLRLEDGPDPDYGRWLADASRQFLKVGGSRLDAVDVSIKWPDTTLRRYQLQRLSLPVDLGQGRKGALSATLKDPTIDLGSGRRVERR